MYKKKIIMSEFPLTVRPDELNADDLGQATLKNGKIVNRYLQEEQVPTLLRAFARAQCP